MLYKIEARTPQGVLLSLPLDDITDGYLVQDLTGLDPVKANMVSSSFARLDGEQYQSSRREKRNMVLTLGLEPDYATQTVQDLRSSLYDFFMPKSRVTLTFYRLSAPTVSIDAYVETFTAPLFTKEPSATISLLAYDPDFIDDAPSSFAGSTTSGTTMTTYTYAGDVSAGFVFTLNVDRVMSDFTLYMQANGDQVRTLQFVAPLQAGDVVKISTVPGDKFVTLTRASTVSSLLYAVSPYSDWLQFQPGTNQFRAQASGAVVPFIIDYTNRYGGL